MLGLNTSTKRDLGDFVVNADMIQSHEWRTSLGAFASAASRRVGIPSRISPPRTFLAVAKKYSSWRKKLTGYFSSFRYSPFLRITSRLAKVDLVSLPKFPLEIVVKAEFLSREWPFSLKRVDRLPPGLYG